MAKAPSPRPAAPRTAAFWVGQVGLGGTWTDDFSLSLDGTWGRGRQWTTVTPAMSIGDATFDANAAYTVSLDRTERTGEINVLAGDVTLDLGNSRPDQRRGRDRG